MARVTGGREATDAEWAGFAARISGAGLVYGVATTGIHCRAECPARLPLRRNLRIFTAVADAEVCGYRACKRCGGGAKADARRDARGVCAGLGGPGQEVPDQA